VRWANQATASTEVKRRVAAHQPGPLLTVAVPTCNGAAHIAQAIRSILSQERVDFELVVSDDRSDDDTLTVVRKAAGDRARVEVNSERLGLAGNWNRW
jgi:glycosyltransferase involved in cell wall biosynthesis